MPVILNVHRISLAAESEAPHRRVRTLHGIVGQSEWRHTQSQAIEYIQNGLFAYYLLHEARALPLVIGRTTAGEFFLKTEPDGEIPALLLQLPSVDATNLQPQLP